MPTSELPEAIVMSQEHQDQSDRQTQITEVVKEKSSAKLAGAKEALKQKLLKAVMQQAMEEIGDAESIADKALKTFGSNAKQIPAATQRLRELIVAEVARTAFASISDIDATAREVAASISSERDELRRVVEALRTRLSESIRTAALESLANTQETAAEIAGEVSIDRSELQAIIQGAHAKLVDAVRESVAERLADSEANARQVFSTFDEDDERVRDISDRLYKMLAEVSRNSALKRLEDSEAVADSIRSTLGEEPSAVLQVADRLGTILANESRDRVLAAMGDVDAVVNEIVESLGENPDSVKAVVDAVRRRLIENVSQQSIASMADVDAAAEQARSLLGDEPEQVVNAASRVRQIMLQEIASRTVNQLSDVNAATEHAMQYFDAGKSSLRQVREVLKTRILNEVLNSAIREINSEVGNAASEIGSRMTQADDDDELFDLEEAASLIEEELKADDAFEGIDGSDLEVFETPLVSESDDHSWQSLGSFEESPKDEYPELTESSAEEANEDDYPSLNVQQVYYVYGIASSQGGTLEGPTPVGIHSGKLEAVDYDGLAAIVSQVPASIYAGEAAKHNLNDADWLKENVRKHASIIEQLRSRQTLLPMPFCTVFPDRDSLMESLSSRHGQYMEALERVDGRQEWGLRVYRNVTLLADKVQESDRRFEGAFGNLAKGVVNYLKEELGRLDRGAQSPIELMTDHCVQRSHEAMLAISADGKANPDQHGQPRANEEIILNAAYLVDDSADQEVRAEVERLKAEYSELGFRFELTGPWPPYHFVTSSEQNSRDTVRVQQ